MSYSLEICFSRFLMGLLVPTLFRHGLPTSITTIIPNITISWMYSSFTSFVLVVLLNILSVQMCMLVKHHACLTSYLQCCQFVVNGGSKLLFLFYSCSILFRSPSSWSVSIFPPCEWWFLSLFGIALPSWLLIEGLLPF